MFLASSFRHFLILSSNFAGNRNRRLENLLQLLLIVSHSFFALSTYLFWLIFSVVCIQKLQVWARQPRSVTLSSRSACKLLKSNVCCLKRILIVNLVLASSQRVRAEDECCVKFLGPRLSRKRRRRWSSMGQLIMMLLQRPTVKRLGWGRR